MPCCPSSTAGSPPYRVPPPADPGRAGVAFQRPFHQGQVAPPCPRLASAPLPPAPAAANSARYMCQAYRPVMGWLRRMGSAEGSDGEGAASSPDSSREDRCRLHLPHRRRRLKRGACPLLVSTQHVSVASVLRRRWRRRCAPALAVGPLSLRVSSRRRFDGVATPMLGSPAAAQCIAPPRAAGARAAGKARTLQGQPHHGG